MVNRVRIAHVPGRIAVLAMVALAADGCTSATHVAFVRDQTPTPSTTVRILVPQEEVYAKVNQSNVSMATGGGLLFALVDTAITNSRSKTAEKQIAPLRQTISDLEVRRELSQRLEPALRNASWLHVQGVTTGQERILPSKRGEIAKSLGTGALLVIETDYALSPDFRVLGVTMSAELRAGGSDKPVYLGRFTSVSDPVASESADAAVAAWAADHGAAFRGAINRGLDEVVAMLRLDFLGPDAAADSTVAVVYLAYLDPLTGASARLEGPVLHRSATRVIVRAKDGNLVALTDSSMAESGPTPAADHVSTP